MIQLEEAQNLIKKFIDLRQKLLETNSPEDKSAFLEHENLCIKKFMYIVTSRTSRYRKFNNYEDLNQEGLVALIKSMKNYNPKKGNFFWWSHRYIDTRIARCANLHTAIRFPLKIAKKSIPHKEIVMPMLVEKIYCPDKQLEKTQIYASIKEVTSLLTMEQQKIINMAYGLDGDKPLSINKICQVMNISRVNCIKTINNALSLMKENIKI